MVVLLIARVVTLVSFYLILPGYSSDPYCSPSPDFCPCLPGYFSSTLCGTSIGVSTPWCYVASTCGNAQYIFPITYWDYCTPCPPPTSSPVVMTMCTCMSCSDSSCEEVTTNVPDCGSCTEAICSGGVYGSVTLSCSGSGTIPPTAAPPTPQPTFPPTNPPTEPPSSVSVGSGILCACDCCIGDSCLPSNVGSFAVPDCNSCSGTGCTNSFPLSCPAPGVSGLNSAFCSSTSVGGTGGSIPTSSPTTINWSGIYQIDSGCDQTLCCCLSGQIVIVQSGNYIAITGPLVGTCNGLTSANIAFTLMSPTDTSASFMFGGDSYNATQLGPVIDVVNENVPQCSGSATFVSNAQSGGSSATTCFHRDTIISYKGTNYTFDEISNLQACYIPHVIRTSGYLVRAKCGYHTKEVKLTHNHLVYTKEGLKPAKALKPGYDVVFSDISANNACTVLSVDVSAEIEEYFGLNCYESEVLANGIKTSTFEIMHKLPAFWMNHFGGTFGIKTASILGDYLVQIAESLNFL